MLGTLKCGSNRRRRGVWLRVGICSAALLATSSPSTMNHVTPSSITLGIDVRAIRDDRCPVGYCLNHHQDEGPRPVDGEKQGVSVPDKCIFFVVTDLTHILSYVDALASRGAMISSQCARSAASTSAAILIAIPIGSAISMARSMRFAGERRIRNARYSTGVSWHRYKPSSR